mmetsp:Transcript_22173/g.33628  ORF Transcript_22173/g.33628 Transcript_22173/m.33628 type:complete len:273 (+) Transcript_22173:3-821(+)
MICRSALTPRLLPGKFLFRRLSRRLLETTTYYDSQSGMHVPVHDETKISVYMNWSNNISIHMYKNQDDAFEVKEEFKTLMSSNISGIFVDSIPKFPRDDRNMTTICDICPPNFSIFARNSLQTILCDYKAPDARETLMRHAENNRKMALAIVVHNNDDGAVEPWEIANEVATLIDTTSAGDFVWIKPSNKSSHDEVDTDDVVRLCEELSYLDVQGPTMKSRLIVDTIGGDNDFVEECMMIGVNKFVVDSVDQVESCVGRVAQDAGKVLVSVG